MELYYQYDPEQFRRPETRLARHIVVTINVAIPENLRAAAHQRITEIAARLAKEPQRFEERALKHSELLPREGAWLGIGRGRRSARCPARNASAFLQVWINQLLNRR